MPTLDRTGQYRRDLGWKRTASGNRSQQRFYLGRNEGAAALAEMRLGQFWTALERYFEKERDGEDCLWEGWSLALAKQIADGHMVVTADVPDHVQAQAEHEGLVAVAGWLNLLEKYFGLICGIDMAAAEAVEELQTSRGEFYHDLGKKILATTGKAPTGETFHGAIDSYISYLHRVHQTAEKVVSQTGKKQGERAARLKRHHPDFPLYDLTAKKIEEVLYYWGKRPHDAKNKRYSRNTCKNQLILIRMFFRWLHRSELEWKLPADYLFPRLEIEWLASEISGEVKKRTFTVKEVGLLWQHATPLERVFIALGINCGFGVGEIGTLAETEVNGKHIRRLRHKTKVFGAWWLYPITRDAVAWARKRKEVMGQVSEYLLVTNSGKPYGAVTKGNNTNQKIRNTWRRLVNRVRKDHPDFPDLSFGKLRKTSASWMRRKGGGEIASIFIAHGKATGDGLLDLYADRQFRKLFECQQRIWKKLEGVLTGAFPEPTKHRPTSYRLDDPLKKRIQKLRRQGYKLAKIAELTKMTLSTVRRIALSKPLDDNESLEGK